MSIAFYTNSAAFSTNSYLSYELLVTFIRNFYTYLMNEYQPQILWEITRAVVSIAAWWVLFYRFALYSLIKGE